MRVSVWGFFVSTMVMAAAGCSKTNPDLCCETAENCAAAGLEAPLPCSAGRICEVTECVPAECQTRAECADPTQPACVGGRCVACEQASDCDASAPVCDLTTYMCSACVDGSSCSSYPDTLACSPDGDCTVCIDNSTCANPTPVCDGEACRACTTDTECDSEFCHEGECIPPSEVVYMAPGLGTACTQEDPCESFLSARTQVDDGKQFLKIKPGTYDPTLSSCLAIRQLLVIHADGATVQPALTSGSCLFESGIQGDIRVLGGAWNGSSNATSLWRCEGGGNLLLQGVELRNTGPLVTASACIATLVDSRSQRTGSVDAGHIESNEANVQLDRVEFIGGGGQGLNLIGGMLTGENVLIRDTLGPGIRLAATPGTSGALRFSTIVNTGSEGSGAKAIQCPLTNSGQSQVNTLTFSQMVVWSETTTATIVTNGPSRAIPGCILTDSIRGPSGNDTEDNLIGNLPPLHNAQGRLGLGSPALEREAEGPALDLDGGARPASGMFDWGADEFGN